MLNNPSTLRDVSEIYAWFRLMRDTQPVWLDEQSGWWHVFRYDDVKTVNTEHHLFSSEPLGKGGEQKRKRSPGQIMISMDPPEHRLYRSLVAPSFTPHALQKLSARIEAIAQDLLDRVRPQGRMDFIADFAYPLPALVIAEMLGVPASDRLLFRQWADELLQRPVLDAEAAERAPDEVSLGGRMMEYFEAMIAERRSRPRNDLMSYLLAAEVEGERLTSAEVSSFCILFLIAGHVTTTHLLSQAIRCLSEHPAAFVQLRSKPDLLPGAIEEVLRYASPLWNISRKTVTEVTLEGMTIPAHAPVLSWLASANRDERQFAEPERFEITRTPNRHQAFGHGIHFCIGAPLSRLEALITLPLLMEQLSELSIEDSHPLELLPGMTLFGFNHLPVVFTAQH